MVVNPQVVVRIVRDAHEFYTQNMIDERYESMALDLVRRYVSSEGLPREVDSFFSAALYVVTRHPWSHPNPLTKTQFSERLDVKESSIDWYTDSIVEKLGFTILYDTSRLPFFMDPQGTIASVVDSVVRSSVGEEVVRSIIKGSVVSPNSLAEKIVDRLCSVVKIVPTAFTEEIHNLVQRKIEEESKRLLDQLEGRGG
ncbi:MAG: hypothetical protein EAX95_02860 [Candidatus Thorarchaeota archaeon]|nr:hypothetical protein [Candidatus Thorarchaeota archaeon]